VDAGRPGLQRAAAQSEGDRGVRLQRAGRRARENGALPRRRTNPGRRVRQRRDRGIPLRARRTTAVVPRGQHPAAGGAPGHRGDHRRRHRQAAAAHRGGRRADRDRARRAVGARACHRGPADRRRPGTRFRARARADPAPSAARWPRHQGRHRGLGGRHHPAAVRFDDRQGSRLGPGPPRGPRPAVPRAPADRHSDRRRDHEQGLPARPAGPAGVRPRRDRHDLAGYDDGRRLRAATPGRRGPASHRLRGLRGVRATPVRPAVHFRRARAQRPLPTR
jgi:hypothetical protein